MITSNGMKITAPDTGCGAKRCRMAMLLTGKIQGMNIWKISASWKNLLSNLKPRLFGPRRCRSNKNVSYKSILNLHAELII